MVVEFPGLCQVLHVASGHVLLTPLIGLSQVTSICLHQHNNRNSPADVCGLCVCVMHVCMYVCMYVYMYVCMYVCMVCMYVRMYIRMYICMNVCVCVGGGGGLRG